MNDPDYVFISYAQSDSAFVNRLSAELRQKGISVWIDNQEIHPGSDWLKEIKKGLINASALIYVISSNSLKSKWVERELLFIIHQEKIILPVLIDEVNKDEIPSFLRNIQWADFTSSYSEGLKSLLRGLESISKSTKPIASEPKKSKGYVFISYTKEDSDFVKYLKSFLKNRGYAYWDYEESDRNYHSQFFLELEGVIIEASATLSVLSEKWKQSKWTVKEFFFSEEVGTPVFLLKAKNISPTLAIAGMTFIDFTTNIEKGLEKLGKELKKKNL